jgi:hypothetical protein
MATAPDRADAPSDDLPGAAARRARIAALRAGERRRDRRRTLVTATAAAALLAAVVAGGALAVTSTGGGGRPATAGIPGVRVYTGLGRQHVTTPVDYPQTPPVGGNHHPTWLDCNGDVYDQPVHNENAVHSLEHGAVWVTYNAKADRADIAALAAKVRTTPYSFMSPYPGQPGTITLTAWGTQLVLDSAADPRVEQFFTAYVQGPQTPEPGASCTAGTMPLSPSPAAPAR